MKYFFDGEKMHTVSEKVKRLYDKKFFIKNKRIVYIWPNQTLSKTPQKAIQTYLSSEKRLYNTYENNIKEIVIAQKKILRKIKKIEKLIKK